MQKMKRILCVAVVLIGAINACQAGESLEAKLAKLEGAAKVRQSYSETSAKTRKAETTAQQDSIKSLTERIDELEARQNSMRKANTKRDEKITSLEKKLTALPEQLNRGPDEALVARLQGLEHKVRALETQSHARQTDTEPDLAIEEKAGESHSVVPAPQVRTHAAPPVIKMTAATTAMADTGHADSYGGEHALHSEPSDLGVTVSATYAGKYIWYGFDEYDDDGAFHPKTEVDLWGSGFVVELGYWTSVNRGHVKYDELEYGLAYSGHTGQGKGMVHYHAHWLYYDYPKRRSEYLDKQEIVVGFSLPHIFPVGNTAIEPFYDAVWIWAAKSDSHVKEIGGYLHRFGLKCDLPVSGTVEGEDQVISLFADVNYNGNMGLYHHTDSTDYDWSHATFGVNTGIELGDLTITPFLNYQISMEDRVNDENEFWGGATVAYPF